MRRTGVSSEGGSLSSNLSSFCDGMSSKSSSLEEVSSNSSLLELNPSPRSELESEKAELSSDAVSSSLGFLLLLLRPEELALLRLLLLA
jgi:hypothetical protein